MYLDALLADQPLTGGLEPMLGDQHVRILTIVGFPDATRPGMLDDLNRLAFSYRWSTRAIMLDKTDATKLLTKIRRQWFAKRKVHRAILKEVMTNEASTLLDTDAHEQGADADMPRCRSSAPTMPAGLCHRDRHRVGRDPASPMRSCGWSRRSFRAATSPHGRDGERRRSLARELARPCLRQCPAAAGFDAQSRPHDPDVGGMGGAGTGRAFRNGPRCCSARPKARPRSGFPFTSATSAIRSSSARPAPASPCCWR
jgi:hypothetical protein